MVGWGQGSAGGGRGPGVRGMGGGGGGVYTIHYILYNIYYTINILVLYLLYWVSGLHDGLRSMLCSYCSCHRFIDRLLINIESPIHLFIVRLSISIESRIHLCAPPHRSNFVFFDRH